MASTDNFIAVEVAGNEPQAEFIASLLRDAGIDAIAKLTNQGAGAGDGLGAGGAHEILVRQSDAEAARQVLLQDRE
ncbi:MAG: putative signal transducing protein [Solirubrobacterales bacterium]